jgi:hypothetical protein
MNNEHVHGKFFEIEFHGKKNLIDASLVFSISEGSLTDISLREERAGYKSTTSYKIVKERFAKALDNIEKEHPATNVVVNLNHPRPHSHPTTEMFDWIPIHRVTECMNGYEYAWIQLNDDDVVFVRYDPAMLVYETNARAPRFIIEPPWAKAQSIKIEEVRYFMPAKKPNPMEKPL